MLIRHFSMELWFHLESNAEPYLYPESDQSENESRIRNRNAASIIPCDALCEGLVLYSVI